MNLKRALVTSAVLSALTLTLAVGPAQGAPGKSDPPAGSSADDSLVKAEVAAARAAPRRSAAAANALAAVRSRIAQQVEARSANTYASYVDDSTGKVVVETDAPADIVSSLVGPQAAEVEVRRTTVSDHFSRKADIPSFWGGSGVSASVGTPWCSSGFVVQNPVGTRFLTTAAHCFAAGTTAVTENGGLTVGTVSNRGPLPPYDMELIGGQSYGASIFVGGVDSSTGNHVVAAADPVVNFTGYCHSGRTSGEACDHKVLSVDAEVCTQTGCKSPVIAWNGGQLSQGGDSGSPFYIKSGTDVHIRGMVIAGSSSTSYAEKWSRISSHLGVTIVT